MHDSFLRWLVLILHRRAGKTTAILNHHQRAATDDNWESKRLQFLNPRLSLKEIHQLLKNRNYWHVMPTFHQAKLTGAWDTLKEISRPIPGVKTNETELLVTYPNGNKLQLVGAEDPDSLRGPALSGVSLDEYSQIQKNVFGTIISKALADHLGYCIFSGTIQGHDHLYDIHENAKNNPEWFALWQDIDASLKTEQGATIMALEQAMADERKQVAQGVISQAEFDQEWYLSAEAAIKGSFYADIIAGLRQNGQITRVPYDPSLPIDTDWDLGIDAMAVWFTQTTSWGQIRVVDYFENVGSGLEYCIKAVAGQEPNPMQDARIAAANQRRSSYMFGEHWGPHDIETTEISSGKTRRSLARAQGINFRVTPKIEVADGITAVQATLKQCYFDEVHCADGIDALTHYRRNYNKRLDEFTATPVHDWASHGADAFRGFCVRYRMPQGKMQPHSNNSSVMAQRTHQRWVGKFDKSTEKISGSYW